MSVFPDNPHYGAYPPPPRTPVPGVPYPVEEPPEKPHPNFWWALLWCIGFVLCTQVPAAIVAGVVLVILMFTRPDLVPKTEDLSTLMGSSGMSISLGAALLTAQLLVIGLSWLVLRVVFGTDWTRKISLRFPTSGHVVIVVMSFPSMALLGDAAYNVFEKVLPSMAELTATDMRKMVQLFSTWPWAFAVLVIGFGPGIGEELWCRGFLGRGLVGRYGVVLGVIFTSFFFGLIHVDPVQGAAVMLMALWLHFVYLTTRSLWMPILLHIMNNSLAVIVPRFPDVEKQLDNASKSNQGLVLALAVLLMLAAGWVLYFTRARLARRPAASESWTPPFKGIDDPPEGSGSFVERPAVAPLGISLVGVVLAGLLASLFLSGN